MTGLQVLDRVRSLVLASPFSYHEATTPFDFDRVPTQVEDPSVRVTLRPVRVEGGFSFSETVEADLELWVAAPPSGDLTDGVRSLHVTARSLTSAVVHDGVTGDYGVGDEGRTVEIDQPEGSSLLVLRLTVPVSYLLTV